MSRWYAEWSTKGTSALSKAGRAGRLPKLSPAQLRRVATELEKGPRSHGYPTDLWTLRRVGEVIEKTTGVSYHPGHVWKVLREQLGERLLPFALHRAPAMSEALAEGMTVMDYAPTSALAEDFDTLAGWVKSLSAPASTSYRGVRWSER